MVDFVCHWSSAHASRLIGVETPAIPLPLLNCLTDIPVDINLHALPFFQLNYHLFSVFITLISSFVSAIVFLQLRQSRWLDKKPIFVSHVVVSSLVRPCLLCSALNAHYTLHATHYSLHISTLLSQKQISKHPPALARQVRGDRNHFRNRDLMLK